MVVVAVVAVAVVMDNAFCQILYCCYAYASLVPRPFEGRRKGLVHTVCTCVIFPVKAGNSYFCPFITP